MLEVTRLTKVGGPLTKRISLIDGAMISDGSACLMSRGNASRARFDGLGEFAALIHSLEPNEAIALGALRGDLPDYVRVITQDRLNEANGSAAPDIIARTSTYISYRAGHAALALIDIDTKGMPPDVRARIKDAGGFWNALVSVVPEMADSGRVIRTSTSTGIRRADTGEALRGSNGMHVYLHVADGGDVERFLRSLHDRCWLSGFGWHMVGAGGQLLDRSLVDRMVYAPERLVFEGAPVLESPLVQDMDSRVPVVFDHAALDTLAVCPALRIVETSELKALKSSSSHLLAPERAKERDRFVESRVAGLVSASGLPIAEARRVIERQCEGILLPDLILPWDHDEFLNCTVADVLADPGRFAGTTMADPLEGVEYGRTKAMVMRRPDGTPWINSFAHGRTVYELKFDARAALAALANATPDTAADAFERVSLNADLTADQAETIRNRASDLSGVGRRALDTRLKGAKKQEGERAKQADRDRRAAERLDSRPQVPAPPEDAPWLPQMQVLNDVLGSSRASEPPMRDIEGVVTQVRVRRVPDMHALTKGGANGDGGDSIQSASEQPLLTRLSKTSLAELIEHHIDYINRDGRSVHLAGPFVEHFLSRADEALPVVAAIATLPLVLPDGTLLSRRGLDRKRGIVFRVPPHILKSLPTTASCTPRAVADAMRFLTDDFLADVSTDYTGKCVLIAAALTVIERTLLPERPAFFVTAGRRGGGKTTTLIMLLMAVTGVRPSAAAWSPNEEERRKSLLAYLMEALPAIVWDNIVRGTQISCPHIEKACTAAFYSDRRLGASEMVAVAASAIHFFTGNNIGPRGDLASRSLQARLEIDRADPENRPFRHPDPVSWTAANRDKILVALYTILMGNPALKDNAAPETRFKAWWTLVGSAVENAAAVHKRDAAERKSSLVREPDESEPVPISFRDLFLSQEEDEEESASLADALQALAAQWPKKPEKEQSGFKAIDLAMMLNDRGEYAGDLRKERIVTLRDFLFPKMASNQDVSAKSVGRMLGKHVGEPIRIGDNTLILKQSKEQNGGGKAPQVYFVHVL